MEIWYGMGDTQIFYTQAKPGNSAGIGILYIKMNC